MYIYLANFFVIIRVKISKNVFKDIRTYIL